MVSVLYFLYILRYPKVSLVLVLLLLLFWFTFVTKTNVEQTSARPMPDARREDPKCYQNHEKSQKLRPKREPKNDTEKGDENER